jgi:hypothetical protein
LTAFAGYAKLLASARLLPQRPAEKTHMAEKTEENPLGDKELLELVDAILKQQDVKGIPRRWTAAEHIALLANAVMQITSATKEEKPGLRLALASHGLGGNASQFRQWLESKDAGSRLPKGTGSKLVEYE